MNENGLRYSVTDEKIVERIIVSDALHYSHCVLPAFESLAEHQSDADVIITIIRGVLEFEFENLVMKRFEKGDILTLDKGTLMKVRNGADSPLEFFAIKAPGPKE